MAQPLTIWGIDLGKCALKAVRLRASGDDMVELLACDYVSHGKVLTAQESDREEVMRSSLEKFLSRNDLSADKIVVIVPGQHTLARFSKLPPLEEKKIPDIVRYEADQQIPFDIDEVVWDYQIFREEDSPDIEVGIFAMKRELIREYLLPFENAAIEPLLVQASPLALYNAVAFDGLLAKGTTVLLDIGTENTDLVVATPHHLWARTIPLGGNSFTGSLVKAFKLSFSKAEKLKRTAETSKYRRQIFQAMRPVFADLVQELQRSIGFYTSTHRDAKLTRCLAMGAGLQLPVLQKYVQQNLGIPVTRPEAFQKIRFVGSPGPFKEHLLSFAVAYGAALQGLGLGNINSSLLPPEIARQVIWRKKRPFFGAAAACLALGAGAIWGRYFIDMGALQSNIEGSEAEAVSVERAAEIIRNDLDPTLPAADYSAKILQAKQALEVEYRKLADKGQQELKTIEQLTKLQEHRTVLVQMYDLVLEALPAPPEPIRLASTPTEYRQAVLADPVWKERKNREQIFIEEFSMFYGADIVRVLMPDRSGAPQVDEIEVTDKMNHQGFLVTLRCRTPKTENTVAFVADTFMANLRRVGRQPGWGFFINRVVLPDGGPISEAESPSRRSPTDRSPRDDRGSRGGRPGAYGERPEPPGRSPRGDMSGPKASSRGSRSSGSSSEQRMDPVMDEPMGQDWIVTVEFDVVLNDLPEKTDKEATP